MRFFKVPFLKGYMSAGRGALWLSAGVFPMTLALTLALALALAVMVTPARAVDVVLVSNNLRFTDLTPHVKKISEGTYDFAIQNTSKEPLELALVLSRADPFHVATVPKWTKMGMLRLVSSDDTEIASFENRPGRLELTIAAGAVRRYILQGDIPDKARFWLWSPDYEQAAHQKRQYFRQMLIGFMAVMALVSAPVAFIRQRKRLFLPAVMTAAYIALLLFKWEVTAIGSGINDLRVIMTLMSVGLIGLHLMVLEIPNVERRYWRSVTAISDVLVMLAVAGWVMDFFRPQFLGVMTAEWLELTLSLSAVVICLAGILSLRLPETTDLAGETANKEDDAPGVVVQNRIDY